MKRYTVLITETYDFVSERDRINWPRLITAIRRNPGVAEAGLALVSYYVTDPTTDEKVTEGRLYVGPLPEAD